MQIINGIIAELGIKGIDFRVELIPASNTNARPGIKMFPEFITAHNTADEGADARSLSDEVELTDDQIELIDSIEFSDYVRNQNGYKSWHFTIDNNTIIQQLPINEIGYHAGDGADGPGNNKSIGIEICEVYGAERTAIKFIAELSKAININVDGVKPHQYWSGKYCPRLILPWWDEFIERIADYRNMTVDRAKDIIQEKLGYDNNTMMYMFNFYKYGNEAAIKLAKELLYG